MKKYIWFLIILGLLLNLFALYSQKEKESSLFQLVRVKYSGGGDWYNDPTGDVNMMKFLAQNTNIKVNPVYKFVDLASDNLFMYPILFLTGHGNVNFSNQEVKNLRAYLENGGFLYIDDDYGLDPYIRKEMKKVFPEQDFVELPFNHGIYNIQYKFPNGLPKIHKHDDKVPQGLGLFSNKRLCVFYTYESNLGDGWVDPDVYKDPEERRQAAFKMGTNIFVWALTH
ncbi:DUF4159 domain-containing protein [Bacteroidetes/Chlorobi group bacterium ChocPot_Mid]|jgi:hypothetical protein|nr:MAG: DUF4159 domain-containing protein [Bacteroidetes/Chlorobi group bacterium ChocPot_Mid]